MQRDTRERGEEERGNVEKEEAVPEIVLLRRRNMARNAAVMASLNIAQANPAAALPKRASTKRPRTGAFGKGGRDTTPTVPLRKSSRLRRKVVDEQNDLQELPEKRTKIPKTSHPREIRDFGPPLDEAAADEKMKELQERIDARDDSKAGTASYEHCLFRVRTMSDTLLARRVRVMERARGAKAVEKMMVFTHVLKAKNKTALLKLAEDALDRLVRGAPMPE